MWSPDQYMIDPRNWMSQEPLHLNYEVWAQINFNKSVKIDDFESEELAIQHIMQSPYRGFEMDVYQVDLESNDSMCVAAYDWDEDEQKYKG
jgi:hypothetical protein